MDIKNTITTLLRDGLILVFNQDKLDVVRTAEALIEAGVNNMEVTCRIKKPLEKLETLCKELPDFVAGAASLIVSAANFRDESFEKFAGKITMIPGCGTVTEIIGQFSKGANLCKVFPAKQLGGPAFVKAIDPAIHKVISLVPTGGTNAGNIPDYIDAGVLVLGGSFSMIEKATMKKIIDEQDYNLLAEELKKIKQLIDQQRSAKYDNIDFTKATIEQISRVTGRNFNLD
jgi:2-dehydro-3-deoxyphosphogluconate aldolase/(4S)-4-hydroxy-2-oxoglutarate aldolase